MSEKKSESDSDSDQETPNPRPVVEKRPPGRPRKTPKRAPIMKSGISLVPKKEENLVEFIHSEPMIYKSAFTPFKAASSQELMFIFDKTEMRIVSRDRKGVVLIMVTFDCSKVVHYYCNEKIVATVSAENISTINDGIGKINTVTSIVIKKDSCGKSITFVFQDEMKIDRIKGVDIITPSEDYQDALNDFDCSKHEVSWEWPSTYFDKMITDIRRCMDTFKAEKNGSGFLTFPYVSDDGKINCRNIVKDKNTSKLVENIAPGDIFSTSALIEYIKPITSAKLSKTIKIYADRNKKMIFISELDDPAIIAKSAVPIVTSASA